MRDVRKTTFDVRRAAVTAVGAAAALLLGPALPANAAPPAPRRTDVQQATATYACLGRHGTVKLRAARISGGRVEIIVTAPGIPAPVTLAAGDVDVTLRLSAHRHGHRRTVAFTGSNPRVRKGGPLRVGPLRAKVAEDTRLDSLRGRNATALELRRGLLGVRCTALSAQRPGPFRF